MASVGLGTSAVTSNEEGLVTENNVLVLVLLLSSALTAFLLICFYHSICHKGVPFDIEEGLRLDPSAESNYCCRATGRLLRVGYSRAPSVLGDDIYGVQLELQQTANQTRSQGDLFGNRAKGFHQYISRSGENGVLIDERSDWSQRNCSAIGNRELSLFGHVGTSVDSPVALRMYKPYHCQQCCCLGGPKMQIDLSDGTLVGRIEDTPKCCFIQQQIVDAEDALRFVVLGNSGSQVPCSCCVAATIQIRDSAGRDMGKSLDTCSGQYCFTG